MSIRQVQIEGLSRTEEHTIRRELDRVDVSPGKLVDTGNLRAARRHILQLGAFVDGVDITCQAAGSGNTCDVVVQVAEDTRPVRLAPGLGSDAEPGLFGTLEIGTSNLLVLGHGS